MKAKLTILITEIKKKLIATKIQLCKNHDRREFRETNLSSTLWNFLIVKLPATKFPRIEITGGKMT